MGFIRVVAGSKNQHVLLKLYQTLVLPIIDYCSPVWQVYKICNIQKLESIQRRATRMILCQRRGEDTYENRLKSLNLTSLVSRKTYLSVSFACSCLINASPFLFCRWCVNTRHDDITFRQTVTAKTNQFKHCLWVQFPSIWSNIPASVRNSFILNSNSVFKSNLKSHFSDLDD